MTLSPPLSDFAERLADQGIFRPTSLPGIYGTNADFEHVVRGLSQSILALSPTGTPDVAHYPPVIESSALIENGYLEAFPHLTGILQGFGGDSQAYKTMMQATTNGGEWTTFFQSTGLAFSPAACYPVYPRLRQTTLPPEGMTLTLETYCYRNEPSHDLTRMQLFRVREFVRFGRPDEITEFVDRWGETLVQWLQHLGLFAERVPANDPFFGRTGRLLGEAQRANGVKFEIVVPITNPETPTAVASTNRHGTTMGERYQIRGADGAPAQSACVGVGLERLALAFYAAYGTDCFAWPSRVRAAIGIDM